MEAAIRENFDGAHLAHDAAAPVLKEYGAERVAFVLANTVQYLEYDGRFSRDNKEWAKGFEIPENISRGMDLNGKQPSSRTGWVYRACKGGNTKTGAATGNGNTDKRRNQGIYGRRAFWHMAYGRNAGNQW